MKRTEWTITKSTHELKEAATAREMYHTKRFLHWQDEIKSAEATLREKGIEIRHHQVTGGTQANVVLDPEMVKHLNTCEAKLRIHQDACGEFARWGAFLDANPEHVHLVTLDKSDFDYFFPDLA